MFVPSQNASQESGSRNEVITKGDKRWEIKEPFRGNIVFETELEEDSSRGVNQGR